MTTGADSQECVHEWRAYTEEEMKALRSAARAGRPSGAWVEAAEQCQRCGKIDVKVSWYGQVHRVPYAAKEPGGPPVVQWPTRAQAPGGGMGMG